MKLQRINNRLKLGLGTLCVVLLAACGGGGGDPVPASPDLLATPAASATVCGVNMVAQSGSPAYTVQNDQSMPINGYDVLISLLTSITGYPYDGGSPIRLGVKLEDLREVAYSGYTERATPDTMGIEMGTRLDPGSVACVAGVTRVMTSGSNTSLLSWASQELPSLPLNLLPDGTEPVNGFEYIHNLDHTDATAVFRMSKTDLADPSLARICRFTSANGGSVDCRVPDIHESHDHLQWELNLHISAAGVYMLAAPLEAQTPL